MIDRILHLAPIPAETAGALFPRIRLEHCEPNRSFFFFPQAAGGWKKRCVEVMKRDCFAERRLITTGIDLKAFQEGVPEHWRSYRHRHSLT